MDKITGDPKALQLFMNKITLLDHETLRIKQQTSHFLFLPLHPQQNVNKTPLESIDKDSTIISANRRKSHKN